MIERLLDTSTCIDFIRGKEVSKALATLRGYAPGAIAISTITLAELRYGAEKSSAPDRAMSALLRFCAPLSIQYFGEDAAIAYGIARGALAREGTPIGPLDLLIAAQALALRVPFVTANEREFRRVPGLSVENWTRV